MQRLWVILLILSLVDSLGFVSVNLRTAQPTQFDDSLHFKFRKIKKDRGYHKHLYACNEDKDCGPGLVCRAHTYGRFCSLSVPSIE